MMLSNAISTDSKRQQPIKIYAVILKPQNDNDLPFDQQIAAAIVNFSMLSQLISGHGEVLSCAPIGIIKMTDDGLRILGQQMPEVISEIRPATFSEQARVFFQRYIHIREPFRWGHNLAVCRDWGRLARRCKKAMMG